MTNYTDTERIDWLVDLDNREEAERIVCTVAPEDFRKAIDEYLEKEK